MSYITQQSRTDGFGAQYQTIINTILYCKKNNKIFIYNPIKTMDHNYNNDVNFLKKIEELMNINIYKSKCEIDFHKIETYSVAESIQFFDANINNLDSYLSEIKKDFWQNKDRNCFKNDCFNIAVHIRRSNEVDIGIPDANIRYTVDEYYLKKIETIREKYKHKKLCFHIYSQGNLSDFTKYNSKDTVFKINMNVFDTFKEMVAADVLIMSKSSFSYIAAILSDGDIYYQLFWHPHMKHWYL
jgi:hypothetical protein